MAVGPGSAQRWYGAGARSTGGPVPADAAAVLSFVFGIGVAPLITPLFLRPVPSRGRTGTGPLHAIGFSGKETAAQVKGMGRGGRRIVRRGS